jgi:hypothetical protein
MTKVVNHQLAALRRPLPAATKSARKRFGECHVGAVVQDGPAELALIRRTEFFAFLPAGSLPQSNRGNRDRVFDPDRSSALTRG